MISQGSSALDGSRVIQYIRMYILTLFIDIYALFQPGTSVNICVSLSWLWVMNHTGKQQCNQTWPYT